MKISEIINGEDSHKIMTIILSEIHRDGPISAQNFETLAYIKKYQPDIFKKYERKLITLMGLFYKVSGPSNTLEQVYDIFSKSIQESTGSNFTPVQADAYHKIKDKVYFSFSAPTSAGKSFLFKELIKKAENDIVIVVPSRALISEYINTITKLVDKSVLVLQFIEIINIKNTTRRIYVITPERGVDLFRNLDRLNIELFLFDEAQLSEDGIRGMKFDSFVRRVDRLIPHAKKVFTHPFIDNPEAQLLKHNFNNRSDSRLYKQHAVGKIYLSYKSKKFSHFSPFEVPKIKTLMKIDTVKEKLLNNGTVLIYVSKAKIYNNDFLKEFAEYIELCPKLENPEALKYVSQLKDFIGASDTDDDKNSLMISMMLKGIVVHHGSMPLKARLLIEEFVNKGFAKICFATSTLTQGVNMPFDIVWIDNFRFSGTNNQKVLDLKNLIGRAGRSISHTDQFDYGYVIIKESSLYTFCKRIKESSTISTISSLDQEIGDIEEDQKDIVEAIKNDTFDDNLQLTDAQVERLKKTDIDNDILFILDNLLIDGKPISSNQYYKLESVLRDKIKNSFKNIYLAHLRRKELSKAEISVLSTSIPILLWQIQGKSFSEIISLRYRFLSEKDKRMAILQKVKKGEITTDQAMNEIVKIKVRFSHVAEPLPSYKLQWSIPLYPKNTSVADLDFDILVYDTYDYIDKVLGQSLRDPLSAAFLIYYEKTKDARASDLSNYIKYGTNDNHEIWLSRYGFSFDDIEWIKNYVERIDENEIIFTDSIKEIDKEKLKIIERFIN